MFGSDLDKLGVVYFTFPSEVFCINILPSAGRPFLFFWVNVHNKRLLPLLPVPTERILETKKHLKSSMTLHRNKIKTLIKSQERHIGD